MTTPRHCRVCSADLSADETRGMSGRASPAGPARPPSAGRDRGATATAGANPERHITWSDPPLAASPPAARRPAAPSAAAQAAAAQRLGGGSVARAAAARAAASRPRSAGTASSADSMEVSTQQIQVLHATAPKESPRVREPCRATRLRHQPLTAPRAAFHTLGARVSGGGIRATPGPQRLGVTWNCCRVVICPPAVLWFWCFVGTTSALPPAPRPRDWRRNPAADRLLVHL